MPNVVQYMMGLETKGFINPLRNAEGAVSTATASMHKSFEKLGSVIAGLGVSFAAFKGIESFVEGFKSAAETGKELQSLHKETHQSITDLVALRKAFEEVGMGAEAVPGVIEKLQAAIGGTTEEGLPAVKIFDKLGLSIDSLKGQSAITQLTAISGAIASLADQESKMAAVRAIFGRGGGGMLALLADPGAIRKAAEETKELGQAYERAGPNMTKLVNIIDNFRERIAGVFVGLNEQIDPDLESLIDAINQKFSSLDLGEKIGKGIRVLAEAVKQGKLGEVIGLAINVGLDRTLPDLGNKLVAAFKGPLAWLQATVEAIFRNMKIGGISADIDSAKEQLKKHEKDPNYAAGNQGRAEYIKRREKELADLKEEERTKFEKRRAQIEANYPNAPFKVGADTADEKKLAQDWGKLVASLKPLSTRTEGEDEGTTGGRKFSLSDVNLKGGDGGKSGGGLPEGDRLAKIGGFVGGGQSQMMDHARRTANATAGILQWQSKIFEALGSKGIQQAWGWQ